MFTMTKLQSQAVAKFQDRDYGALFTDMGTGKTRVLLELARMKQPGLILYVCFNNLKQQVAEEARKLSLGNVEIVSYEAIAGSDRTYLETIKKVSTGRVVIIADESTALKNDSKTTQRLMELRKHAEVALIATATPITNDELDLYNQMQFLSPNVLKMTKADFLENFYRRIVYRKRGMKKPREFFVFSNINREYLQKILDQVSIQGSLELQFDITETINLVEPADETMEVFNERRQKVLESIDKGTLDDAEALNFLVWVNKLFSTDPTKNHAVAEHIAGKKIVCFSMFRDEQQQISNFLDTPHLVMNGDTPELERTRILDEFAVENIPLLITYGVGGRGLNLQTANHSVFSSVTFDWEKIEQARGRTARLGQTSKQITYEYVLPKSQIVEMIHANLTNKTKIAQLVKEIIDNV